MRSPDEIRSHGFLVSLRGYDRDEVDTYLASVADDVEQLQRQMTNLTEKLESGEQSAPAGDDPEPASRHFAEISAQTRRILEAAEESAAQIRAEANAEVSRERREVRSETTRQIAEAERRVEQLQRAAAHLEATRDEVGEHLRAAGRLAAKAVRDHLPDAPRTSVREALRHDRASTHAVPDGPPSEPPESSEAPTVSEGAEPTAPDPAGLDGQDTDDAPPEAAAPAEGGEPEAAAPRPSAPAWNPDAVEDLDPFTVRADALRSLHPRLIRSVKRRLRPLAEELWESADDHEGDDARALLVERVAEAGRPVIARAHQAGADAGARLVGVPSGADLDEPVGISTELARRLIDEVCTLAGDRRGAGQGQQEFEAAVDQMSESSLPEHAAFGLLAGYERGLLDTWVARGVTHRRWVRPSGARCPGDSCAQNAASSAATIGSGFPSGHDAPPVGIGCTCTTVPDRATA